MSGKVFETQLEPIYIAVSDGDAEITDGDIEIIEPDSDPIIEEDTPHLVFLIPGIRTNGMWTQDVIDEAFTVSGREVVFRTIRGSKRSGTGRLSSWHLISRLGLESFRQSFIEQISLNLDEFPDSPVSIFAHSLGSSLFAEIVDDVKSIMEKQGRRIENIVFLGSVCHRTAGLTLKANSRRFINDVGINDLWPYRASVIRSSTYSDVGFWGFRDGSPTRDRYFHNDHSTCTSIQHIEQNLIPLLEFDAPVTLGIKGARPPRSDNYYEYWRRALRIGLLVIVASFVFLVFQMNLGIAVGITAFLLVLWTVVLLKLK